MNRYHGHWKTTTILGVWIVCLGALWVATHSFQTTADSMNMGWAIIPAVAACAVVIGRKRRSGEKTSKEWLYLLLPAIACLLLAVMNRSALHELLRSPSRYSLTKFEYSLSAFILVFIGWIVAYPFDQVFVPLQTGTRQLRWTASFAIGGLLLGWYIGRGVVYLANGTLHPVITDELQLWIQKANFLLSAFVVARVLLHVTVRGVGNSISDSIS